MQPWADEIVKGNLPILIRTFTSHHRGRIYIVASTAMDKNDLYNIEDYKLLQYYIETQGHAIGSVDLVDVIKVKKDDLEDIMKKIMRKKFDNYPPHFIPEPRKDDSLFIWIFRDPKKWEKGIHIDSKGGISWVNKAS